MHVFAFCITSSYSICWFIVLFFFLLCITYSYSVQCFILSYVLLALYFSLEVISSRLTLIYFGCEHINMSVIDDFSFKSIIFLSNYLFRMFCCLNSFLFNSSFSLNIIPASLWICRHCLSLQQVLFKYALLPSRAQQLRSPAK